MPISFEQFLKDDFSSSQSGKTSASKKQGALSADQFLSTDFSAGSNSAQPVLTPAHQVSAPARQNESNHLLGSVLDAIGLGDTRIAFKKGWNDARALGPKIAAAVGDLVGADEFSSDQMKFVKRMEDKNERLTRRYSPSVLQGLKEIQETAADPNKGVLDQLAAHVKNPTATLMSAYESAPQSIGMMAASGGTGLAAKGVMKAVPAIAARINPVSVAMKSMAGMDAAGNAADTYVAPELQSVSKPRRAAAALATGLGTYLTDKYTDNAAAGDVIKSLIGGAKEGAIQKVENSARHSAVSRAVKGALSTGNAAVKGGLKEGVLNEAPQQIIQDASKAKARGEDLDINQLAKQGTMAAATAFPLGGFEGVASHGIDTAKAKKQAQIRTEAEAIMTPEQKDARFKAVSNRIDEGIQKLEAEMQRNRAAAAPAPKAEPAGGPAQTAEPAVVPSAAAEQRPKTTQSPVSEKQGVAADSNIDIDLTPSEDSGTAVLQNRDRSTPGSITQMRNIAADPDYERVSFSRELANGAPVVSFGTVPAEQRGRVDYAKAADGTRIPVQYAVVESDTIDTSNGIDGSVNPAYPEKNGRIKAIAGNGRITGISYAYKAGRASGYRQRLISDAALTGVNPTVIEGMRSPVLVRLMPGKLVKGNIGDLSNQTGTLSLSAVEQAETDSARVDLGNLHFNEDGSPTIETVEGFVQSMPEAEQQVLIDRNGAPTRQAVDRLNAAVFSKGYEDPELTRLYAQASDPEARLVMSALAQIASKAARLEGAGDLDIRSMISDAAKAAVNAKRQGLSLREAASQIDMDEDPNAYRVLQLFAVNPRSNKRVIEILSRILDRAYEESHRDISPDMLSLSGAGEAPVPRMTREQLAEEISKETENYANQRSGKEDLEQQGGAASVRDVAERRGGDAGRPGDHRAPEANGEEPVSDGQAAPEGSGRQEGLKLSIGDRFTDAKQKIQRIVQRVRDGLSTSAHGRDSFEDYLPVSEETAERISKLGFDVRGYVHSLTDASVAHILNRHSKGMEEREDQIPLTDSDLFRLPEVVNQPDEILPVGRSGNSGNNVLLFRKAFPDGTSIFAEEIRKGRKKLMLLTAYKKAPAALDARPPKRNPPLKRPKRSASSLPEENIADFSETRGATVEEVDDSLRSDFGDDLVDGLKDNGVVEIIQSEGDLPSGIKNKLRVKYSQDGAVQGLYDPKTGKSYLIASNLTRESAPAVLLHEVGIHASADPSMKPVFRRAVQIVKNGQKLKGNDRIQTLCKKVQARLDQAGETSAEEATAYLVEEARQAGFGYEDRGPIGNFLRQFALAVKTWITKHIGNVSGFQLSIDDLVEIARANVKNVAENGPATESSEEVMLSRRGKPNGFFSKDNQDPLAPIGPKWMPTGWKRGARLNKEQRLRSGQLQGIPTERPYIRPTKARSRESTPEMRMTSDQLPGVMDTGNSLSLSDNLRNAAGAKETDAQIRDRLVAESAAAERRAGKLGKRAQIEQVIADVIEGARDTGKTLGVKAKAHFGNINWRPGKWFGRDQFGARSFVLGRDLVTHTADYAYDVLQTAIPALRVSFSLKPLGADVRKMLRAQKAEIDRTQRAIGLIGTELQTLPPEDRELISDIIEKTVKTGVVPPKSALDLADKISKVMTEQTKDLVDLGMLSSESADRWRGRYLPRFYSSKELWRNDDGSNGNLFDYFRNLFRLGNPHQGIAGGSLKARGIFKEIPTEALQDFVDLGWEVRDPDYEWKREASDRQGHLFNKDTGRQVEVPTTVTIWRDWTPSERMQMGEIRDASYRFVLGGIQMAKDISLGHLFRGIANNPEWTRSSPSEGWSKVPDTEIPGTGGVKRYGALSGKWVRDDVLTALMATVEVPSGFAKAFRAVMSYWKEGKTALNPVSHMNNVVGNIIMCHLGGVPIWNAKGYVEAIRDMYHDTDRLHEAMDAGLITGSFSREEIAELLPPEFKDAMGQTESGIKKGADFVWNFMSLGLRGKLREAYALEDSIFKLVLYNYARDKGATPEDAVDHANRFIFAYDDLPTGAQWIRNHAIPFFAWTYKAMTVLPVMAAQYPWRFAMPAVVLHTMEAVIYAMAAGTDDDDWLDKFEKGQKLRAAEEQLKPEYLRGTTAFFTPKAVRLGIDDATGMPRLWNMQNFLPGGNFLDPNNQMGGIGVPDPIMPSHPVVNTLYAMIANVDSFSGNPVALKSDTVWEKAYKRAGWLYRQCAPALAVGGYHFDRLANAAANATGVTVRTPWGDYTGVGRSGQAFTLTNAMLNTIGVKVRDVDYDHEATHEAIKLSGENREISSKIKSLARARTSGAVSDETFNQFREEQLEKIRRNTEAIMKITEANNERKRLTGPQPVQKSNKNP